MKLRSTIKFLGLVVGHKSVQKLSIAKSYKNSATMIFPIQWNFHLNDKIADFLRNYNFFCDSPVGYALLLGLCAALHSIAQHVFASAADRQIGLFTRRIAHIVYSLYNSTKGIFILMVPKDLNAFLTIVHAAETAN